MRIPRKLKKKIPKDTFYCYKFSHEIVDSEGNYIGYKVKPCHFYSWKDSLCKLLNIEIEDQCKSCGARYGKY